MSGAGVRGGRDPAVAGEGRGAGGTRVAPAGVGTVSLLIVTVTELPSMLSVVTPAQTTSPTAQSLPP